MNIKLHDSPHTCSKGSCDLKDECNHLHWFENVLLSLFWSSSASTSASTITTTLHWFEDVRVCLRLFFPIRGLPESAGACSELESCSCYDLFAVFVTVFVITVFVTVFVLSLSLISRSMGCQSACSELKSIFSSLFLLLWSLFIESFGGPFRPFEFRTEIFFDFRRFTFRRRQGTLNQNRQKILPDLFLCTIQYTIKNTNTQYQFIKNTTRPDLVFLSLVCCARAFTKKFPSLRGPLSTSGWKLFRLEFDRKLELAKLMISTKFANFQGVYLLLSTFELDNFSVW